MNKLKTITRIKIFASLLLTLLVVSYGAPRVFIAGTAQINPELGVPQSGQELIAGITTLPQVIFAYIQHPLDGGARTDTMESIKMMGTGVGGKEDLQYQPVSNGVYAAEDPVTKERFYKIERGTVLEKSETVINGRNVTVYSPAR